VEFLIGNPWWGNVRKLKNTIEKTCLLENTEVIRPEHTSLRSKKSTFKSPPDDVFTCPVNLPLDRTRKLYIERMLERTNGNKSRALEFLGIS
jgi:DNA-binding NtrC family response regulator